MSKERKRSSVVKPSIDYATVLQFAAAGDAPQTSIGGGDLCKNPTAQAVTVPKGQVPLTVMLKEDVHAALQREAVRKGRTVEDLVRKVLTKHCKSD